MPNVYLLNRKEGMMNEVIYFMISVAAGIVAYYICKWLDGDK